jgi:hypothetical protein
MSIESTTNFFLFRQNNSTHKSCLDNNYNGNYDELLTHLVKELN